MDLKAFKEFCDKNKFPDMTDEEMKDYLTGV